MDNKEYLNSLKTTELRPGRVRIEKREQVLMETVKPRHVPTILRELFVAQGEIESMPKGARRDMAILRIGMIAELDAANFYERLAELASNSDISKIMFDVANEEKVHAGEFETLLERVDSEYKDKEEEGEEEVEDKTGKD